MYNSIQRLKLAFSSLAAVFALFIDASVAQAADPLSSGPLPLTAAAADQSRAALRFGGLYTDADCEFTPKEIQRSEVLTSELPADVCMSRTQELVYLPATKALVACDGGRPEFAIKAVIGSGGVGKTREGNRKSPFGTYWVGYPRHSPRYGVFIPIGYPNLENIDKGRTGSDIGIHGPRRGLHCFPQLTLARNWTAGCIALSRDSQIIRTSEWILDHWPVKISITKP